MNKNFINEFKNDLFSNVKSSQDKALSSAYWLADLIASDGAFEDIPDCEPIKKV